MSSDSSSQSSVTSPQAYAAFTRRQRQLAGVLCEIAREKDLPSRLPHLCFGDNFVAPKGKGITARVMQHVERSVVLPEHESDIEQFLREFVGPVLPVHPPSPRLRNAWESRIKIHGVEHQVQIYVMEMNPDAPTQLRRVRHERIVGGRLSDIRAVLMLDSAFLSSRHFVFAEEEAMKKLRTLVLPHEYGTYVLNGTLRVSGKSGVCYLIRKGRPTLAYRHVDEEHAHFLATLCLHPLGYHYGTWVGTLPPTDEVIAHLLMIRGDEHCFWKKSEQHQLDETVSGI